MAQVSISQNYYEDAIPLLESGLQSRRSGPTCWRRSGESYFMSGKVDKAIEEFQKLIAGRTIGTLLCLPWDSRTGTWAASMRQSNIFSKG